VITIISSFSTNKVLYEKVNSSKEMLFRVTTSAFLTKIELNTKDNKTLDSYAISIYQQNKKIFYIDRDSVYFSKHTLDNSWSQSAKGADIYLKLDTGQYLMKVDKISTTQNPIKIMVEQRVIRLSYILPIAVLFLMFIIYSYFINSYNKTWAIVGALFPLVLLLIYTDIPIILIIALLLFILLFIFMIYNYFVYIDGNIWVKIVILFALIPLSIFTPIPVFTILFIVSTYLYFIKRGSK